MEDPVHFALTVLFILVTPGPTNTLLATAGAALGLRRALPLVPAEAAGYTIAILALGLVLGPWVRAMPGLETGLRVAVAAYLALVALRLWRGGQAAVLSGRTVGPVQVFVTTLLNPKAIVFAFGVMPFGAEGLWAYTLGFVGLLGAVALGWIVVGARLGDAARAHGRGALVPRIGAAAVALFAVLLVALPLLRGGPP